MIYNRLKVSELYKVFVVSGIILVILLNAISLFGINHNITIKIQPTLWEFNQEDYREIIEHYLKIGIKWFTFHAGSFEAL